RFGAAGAADKRARKLDEVRASKDHAESFGRLFADTLIGGGDAAREVRPDGLAQWLEDAFAKNRPWNDVVYDLVSASGLRSENGAVNFVLRWSATPEDMAGAASRF